MSNTKRWLVSSPITPQADQNLIAFPPILRQILFNRGYATEAEARAFLEAETLYDPSPFRLKDMSTALERIQHAIDHSESIAIYGDYDVDGVTATVLLVQTLQSHGANVIPYIPNRFDEGYGLNNDALTSLKEQGVQLVITVDCGIRSQQEAAHAKEIGLDLIISDHHQPLSELPRAFAVINPKQKEDSYPDKDLAGVGVAYKIAQALADNLPPATKNNHLDDMLDLVALGTVADLAPLVGENRMLVRKGLQCIRETKRQGLFSLAAVADISLPSVNATSIGFMLGPRLNAAGRLESALAAYELLKTGDVKRAGELAQQLSMQNRQRQELTLKIQQEAESIALAEDPNALILFAVHPSFNPGVVGLAAARLVETYYRPTIVGQINKETTRCSCRSIPEFHITEALDRCADLLIQHGGHAAAAGFTVRNENVGALKERLISIAAEKLADQNLRPTLHADREVTLEELKPELLKYLDFLQPTGYGNPDAVFVSRNVKVQSSRTVGSERKHLKLIVSDGRLSFDAIGFRMGHLQPELSQFVDIIYNFEINEYKGRVSLQLNLRDLKKTGISD